MAAGSPWTMNVIWGGRENPPSQRTISAESAWADIDSIRSTWALTEIICP